MEKNLVYVKFGYSEAVSSKRDLLSCEIDFLNILKKIDSFKDFRKKELTLKSRLVAKSKKFRAELNRMVSSMPEIPDEVPDLEKIKPKSAKVKALKYQKQRSIEKELNEIKEKLADLAKK